MEEEQKAQEKQKEQAQYEAHQETQEEEDENRMGNEKKRGERGTVKKRKKLRISDILITGITVFVPKVGVAFTSHES